MEAHIRIGPLIVRFITLYGRPSCQAGSREANQELLQAAYEQVVTTRIPTIIAGDLNAPIESLPAGQSLLVRGFKEIFHLHQAVHNELLPPTCKGSTRNDTLLLDPVLVPFFDRAWVLDKQKLFDARDPLCVRLKIPRGIPCTLRWDLPHSWSQHEPDPKLLNDSFLPLVPDIKHLIESSSCSHSLSVAFQDWASSVEDAVHTTLQKQRLLDLVKNPPPGLPKRARGRCQPRKAVLRPAVQCSRPSRQGEFEPDQDATTVLARMKVKQVRRVESLLRVCQSKQRAGTLQPHSPQLTAEWAAIKGAKGYPPVFATWVFRTAHLCTFPVQLPALSWLEDLLAYLRFDCNAVIAQEFALRKDRFKLAVQLDSDLGAARQGYAAVRGPSNPPLTEVPVSRTSLVSFLEQQGPEQYWYTLDRSVDFFASAPARLADRTCHVLEVDQERILLQGCDLPNTGELHQEHAACTPDDLAQEFSSYWSPMWERGPALGVDPNLCATALRTLARAPMETHHPRDGRQASNRHMRLATCGVETTA